MSIKHFQGTTSKFLGAIREKEPVGPIFFKPYQSPLDILGKTTSIITDPLVISVVDLSLELLYVGSELLKFIGNSLTFSPLQAVKNLGKAGKALFLIPISLVVAALSPLINLIDLIGSAVTTLMKLIPAPKHQSNMQEAGMTANLFDASAKSLG